MSDPTIAEIGTRLGVSFALDRLWRETMGLPEGDTKEAALRRVTAVLEDAGTPYAVIGGVAIQLYSEEPRTTLDIDLAVTKFADIPRDALLRAGFDHDGRHEHSDNWRAPGAEPRRQRTAVQFSAEDVGIAETVARARLIDVAGFHLRVATVADLLVLKLAAAEEPRRRARKRRQDLLDVIALAEDHPEAAAATPDLETRIARLSATILIIGKST
jgi:predicted nucleotidyltransferase